MTCSAIAQRLIRIKGSPDRKSNYLRLRRIRPPSFTSSHYTSIIIPFPIQSWPVGSISAGGEIWKPLSTSTPSFQCFCFSVPLPHDDWRARHAESGRRQRPPGKPGNCRHVSQPCSRGFPAAGGLSGQSFEDWSAIENNHSHAPIPSPVSGPANSGNGKEGGGLG